MKLENSILRDVRAGLGLSIDDTSFDVDLIMHINALISKINQNGACRFITVSGEETTWEDLMDPTQVEGNKHFQLVPLYMTLTTKLFFDPPPPSTAEYYSKNSEEILWRLKIAYEPRNETNAGTL